MSLKEIQSMMCVNAEGFYKDHPDFKKCGVTLFLGRHYAVPGNRILMLGINPGGSEGDGVEVSLQPYNYLLGNPQEAGIGYWKIARGFFGANPSVQKCMEFATFSFCVPFRSSRWNNLKAQVRKDMIYWSKPIIRKMIEDCQADFLLVTGVTAYNILTTGMLDLKSDDIRIISSERQSNFYQWKRVECVWGEKKLTVIQLPHFSWANGIDRLGICSTWLAEQLADVCQYEGQP